MPHFRPLLLGASALALAAPVHAQDTTVLAPIVVQGVADPTAPAGGFVATTAASTTKTGTPRLETQQTDSVVTAEQIEATGATTLGQALNYSAGVFGEPFGLDSRGDAPRLRGFDGGNSQFLNGLKLLRSNTTPSFETYGLERVEVLHGPAGVLYGAGNPGGMINQIQKRAQFDDFNEVGLSFGTNQRAETFFDMNRTVSPDVAYRFTGVLRHQNGNAEEVNDDRVYLAPAVTWEIDGQNTLTFLGSYQWDNPEQPTSVDISALNGSDPIGRDFYMGEEDFNDSDRRQINVGLEWTHRFNDAWELSQSFRYQTFDWDYQWLYFDELVAGNTVRRSAIEQHEDTSTVNLDTRLLGRVTTGSVDHALLFGLDIRRYEEEVSTAFAYDVAPTETSPGHDAQVPDLSASNPDYGIPFTPDYNYRNSSDLTFRQLGVYAQDELSFGNWRGTVGLRHDLSWREGTSGGAEIDEDSSKTTGRAGLSYVFANGIAPFVSYATSFDPTVGTDLITNQPLSPSEGKQWEAGVKYQPTAFDGFFTATMFDLRQTNVSYSDFGTTPASTKQRDARSRGVELEGVARLTPGVTLRAAYSYTDATIEGGPNDGNDPENTPDTVASLWLGYDFSEGSRLDGLSLGGGLRYIGERFGDAANAYKMDSETLLDASVAYRLDAFSARLTVQNLTDEEYLANCGSFGCTYGAGRTVVADVAYTW